MEYDGFWRELSQGTDKSIVGRQPIGTMTHCNSGNDDKLFFWNRNGEDQNTFYVKTSTAGNETLVYVSDGLFESNSGFWSQENTIINSSFKDCSLPPHR